MIDFNHQELIKKYGSWIHVQVAFYDFLFLQGVNMCPSHFKEKAQQAQREFRDGAGFYENAVSLIEQNLKTQEEAWNLFLEAVEAKMKQK